MRKQTTELQDMIDSGDRTNIEDKMDDLMRTLTEFESAG
jgi:hypothetical protein